MNRFEVYDVYLRRAYALLKDKLNGHDAKLFSSHESFRTELCNNVAERMAVGDGFTPPTFTGYTECDGCGDMPVPEDFPTRVDVCPWCDTDWNRSHKRLVKEWLAYENSKGARRHGVASKLVRGEESVSESLRRSRKKGFV